MITVITPTGDRPEAFELCRKWMSSQTRKPDQWIVVDDGKKALEPDLPNMQYVRRKPKKGEPQFTLAKNLLKALQYVIGSEIIIMEDDDYYSPNYIEDMANKLRSYELVGYKLAKYYHVKDRKYYQFRNEDYASLCQTGFRSALIGDFLNILDTYDKYIDVKFWRESKRDKRLFLDDKNLMCGIKGLPGRKGIGAGHNTNGNLANKYQNDDENLSILKSWVPSDYEVYLQYGRKQLNDNVSLIKEA